MSNPAEADPSNNTLGSFLTSLALNGGLLVIQVGIFVLLKSKLGRIYFPRSYLSPPNLRADPLKPGPWRWLPQTLFTRSESIIHKNGLDAYMSIRFFEMMIKVFLVYTLVTWPILLPIDAIGMPITQSDGLGRLGFGNINKTDQSRYWAHLILAYGLTFFVLWLMRKELLVFIRLRHEFLLSPDHSRLAQAKTVLITSVPRELATEADLRQLFSFVPGGIKRIWIHKHAPGLPEAYQERLDLCDKLEGATTGLLQTAIKAKSQQQEKTRQSTGGKGKNPLKPIAFPMGVHANLEDEAFAGDLEKIGPEKVLEGIHRPTHRLGWIPFCGKQVDTIDYCVEHIRELNERIKELRLKLPEERPSSSCFIQCNLQIGAHVIGQCVSYHKPLFMSQRWIEMAPEDVVWSNIDDGAYEIRTRYAISWAATLGLLILWGFPVALAGFTSNVDASCASHRWLAWICRTPKIVQSIIQGVFPPVLLAILFIILPYLLRGLAWFENIPRYSLISLSVYKRYFMFLVVHGFLIITFFSALSEVLRDLQDPSKVVQNFAVYLPNASTFFLTYMLQQGLMGAASALLQVGPLVLYFVEKIWFGHTPREAFQATFLMPSFDFGIMLPRMSLLATIGLAYSIIAPIINGLALVTFMLFWVSWKFLLIWVLDQPESQETSGLYFPLLISNLFTGLYLQQICLMGLFFFANDTKNQHVTISQGILMAVLIFITACIQIFYHSIFNPVITYLPMSLSTQKLVERFDKKRKGDAVKVGDMGLFSHDYAIKHKLRSRRGVPQRIIPRAVDTEKAKQEGKQQKAGQLKEKKKDSEKKVDEPPANTEGSKSHISLQESQKSGKSGHLSKERGPSKIIEALLDAAPDTIKIDAPAKALVNDDSDLDDDLEDNAFNHPSVWEPQRFIWLPQWEAFPALSEELVKELMESKVDASDLGAVIDDGGNVKVMRGPPDEDWSGGLNM